MSRPPRIPGFSYLGPYRYFLTFCTWHRREIFGDQDAATAVIAQIRRTARDSRFAVLAFCVMPDHVHLLVEGLSSSADLRRFVKCVKQSTGQTYRHRTGHRLWQEGYFDRVLRRDEQAKAVARYIVENPVRANLVTAPAEYPHLGSDVWSIRELMESMV